MYFGVNPLSLKLPMRCRSIVRTYVVDRVLFRTFSVARAPEPGGRPPPTQKHQFVVDLQRAFLWCYPWQSWVGRDTQL